MIAKMMNLNYFRYKNPFSGSAKGHRFKYVIQMQEFGEKKDIHVMCYVGEKNSKETPDAIKKFRDFEFSEEGYEEALDWLSIESDKIDT